MNRYMKRLYSVKPLLAIGLTLLTLMSCEDEPTHALVVNFPTQRVIATKTFYLGIYGSQPPLVDTVVIHSKTYQSAAFDSTTFQYDEQDRLIRLNLLQVYSHGSDYPGEQAVTTRNVLQTEYVYLTDKLLIWTGHQGETKYPTEALLDQSQRRIASRSWYDPAGFVTVNDTLQTYSTEGLLINTQRILTGASYPRQTIGQLSLVGAGNIVQTSTSFVETGQAFETTTYEYDLSRRGPLSTTTMLGENSRNALLRATTLRHEQSHTSSYEYTYYNEYDQKGRLVRQTKYYQSPGALQRELQTLTKFYYQ